VMDQLAGILAMDFSPDLSEVVTMLSIDAQSEVNLLQSGAEECLSQGRFDLFENIATASFRLEDLQGKLERWKQGLPTGSVGGVSGLGGDMMAGGMSDDERAARALAAQFEEEDRAAAAAAAGGGRRRSTGEPWLNARE